MGKKHYMGVDALSMQSRYLYRTLCRGKIINRIVQGQKIPMFRTKQFGYAVEVPLSKTTLSLTPSQIKEEYAKERRVATEQALLWDFKDGLK